MTDKEILERIIELNGRCASANLECRDCPLYFCASTVSFPSKKAIVEKAKQKLKEMTEREILEKIIDGGGHCEVVCCGTICPLFSGDCRTPADILKTAKQKLKEMESEMEKHSSEYEIPELKGVKMLVRDHGETCYSHATVIGRFEGIYIDSLRRQWQEAKPLPKPWEIPPEGYRIVTEEEREIYPMPNKEIMMYTYPAHDHRWVNHPLTDWGNEAYVYAVPLDFSFEPEEMTVAEICKELGREIKVKKG